MWLIVLLAALFVATAAAQTTPPQAPLIFPDGLPAWAFNIPDAVQPPAAQITGIVQVPNSTRQYDAAAIAGNVNPPDWFPAEHPVAPRVVSGPAPNACGSCHLMSGQGHPESADIAGLPAEYIIRQMSYFKSGARKEENRMGPIARATSDDDVRLAAQYYSAIEPIVFVNVVETAAPPKTYVSVVARHRMLAPEGGTEPIGLRIIQIPDDPVRTSLRDPHSGFVAYVPPGSIRAGRELVETGGAGKCASCHGEALRGIGEVPRIAGMQPLYLARQLFGLQNGSSAGGTAAAMKESIANLSEEDIIALAAYLGSLPPR